MTIIHVLPWPLWLSLVIAVLVAVALATRRPLGIIAILVILAVAAPRPVPEPAPSTMGVGGIEQAVVESAVAQGRTAALPGVVAMAPQPTNGTQPAWEGTPVTAIPSPGHTLRGIASWVRASLGSRYLAARMPKGTVLRITGPLGSVVRVVMDYGPSKRLHPDRIVDLSRRDFARVCGDPILMGTCRVRVRVVNVVPPETDTP